jgi:hypothetical protein
MIAGGTEERTVLRHLPSPIRGALRLLPALTVIMVPVSSRAVSSLCTNTEAVFFACQNGSDLISVCALHLSGRAGSVHYRFGPQNRPKIDIPGPEIDWRTRVRAGLLTFAGGGGAYLAFKSEAYRYVVYTATVEGEGDKSGVAVEKNSKLVSNIRCKDQPVSELGPDLFHQGGFPEDTEGFDLP